MQIDDRLLTRSEAISLKLRSIYDKYGYKRYNMTKFEEYKLYAGHMDFLVSDNVITFTDTNGKLMALKPDITLSIVKNFEARPQESCKLYYNENVYRVSKGTGNFREITQVGVESLGNNSKTDAAEVIMMAKESLEAVSENSVLVCSHLGILMKAISSIKNVSREELLKHVSAKSFYSIDENEAAVLLRLMKIYGKFSEVKEELASICETIGATAEMHEFEAEVSNADPMIDFSLVSDPNYYSGVVMSGFIEGIPESVLSGGRYDKLLSRIGMKAGAVGFAIYLDRLERI